MAKFLGNIIIWFQYGVKFLKDLILRVTATIPLIHDILDDIFGVTVVKNKFMVKFSQLGMINISAMWVTSWFSDNPHAWLAIGAIVSILGSFAREFRDEMGNSGFNPMDILAAMAQAWFIYVTLGSLIIS
jgi:hypothetical protein